MKTIAILASGPPKPGRNRHLEIFNSRPCIAHVIENCTFDNIPIIVIINHLNIELNDYLKKYHSNVVIIHTENESMLTTYEKALFYDANDTLIVAGDLWNLRRENIEKYIHSPYLSALYRLKTPWGSHLKSNDNTLIRRGDIGDAVVLIANAHKEQYISKENIGFAKYYFNKFYPHILFDIRQGNHLWTWLDYSFFFEISSSLDSLNEISTEKGAILIEDLIYLDND